MLIIIRINYLFPTGLFLDLFNVPALNALWRILVGETIDQTNTDLIQAISYIEHCLANLNSTLGFLAVFSKYFLFILEKFNILSLTKNWWKIYDVIDTLIESHISKIHDGGVKDFIDVFIQDRIKNGNSNGWPYKFRNSLRNLNIYIRFRLREKISASWPSKYYLGLAIWWKRDDEQYIKMGNFVHGLESGEASKSSG